MLHAIHVFVSERESPHTGKDGVTDMGPLPALVINLADQREQFNLFRRRFGDHIPEVMIPEVMNAVDGRQSRLDLRDVPLTTNARYSLLQRERICQRRMLNSPEAVATFLSHRACWRRVVDARWPAALIFEDDACPQPAWRGWVEGAGMRLAERAGDWDCVLVGYETVFWHNHRRLLHDVPVAGTTLWLPTYGIDDALYGAHAYLVSQRGAERLLRLSECMEIHIDHFLLLTSVLNLIEGYVATPNSLVRQCQADGTARHHFQLGRTIPHYNIFQKNLKSVLPDVTVGHTVCVVVAVIIAGWVLRWIQAVR